MNIKNKEKLFKGVQLGIAMQFTNIARDIKEDLQRGRIYFPKKFRINIKQKFNDLTLNPDLQKAFSKDLKDYLNLTDKIYMSSWKGIIKLPLRYKVPIAIAAYLYQSIGSKIKRKKYNIWDERIYLSTFEKIHKTLEVIFLILFYDEKNCDPIVDKKIKKILKMI